MVARRAKLKLPTLRQWRAMVLGSDRPGHLTAAVVVGAGVVLVGLVLRSNWVVQVGVLVPCWEWACTPDVDIANRRSRGRGSLLWQLVCLVWWPYAKVVGHRSRLSHSLAFGLPCRLGYVGAIAAVSTDLLSISVPWLDFVTLVWVGVIGDATHLLKDNYSLEEVVWGQ